MAATFDPSLATPLDRVRLTIGDTEVAKPLVQDETIAALLEGAEGENAVSARLAQHLAALFARKVDTAVDGQSHSYSKLYEHYTDLARRLFTLAGSGPNSVDIDTAPGFGGILVSGATSQDVCDARTDCSRAGNAPPAWRLPG